MFCQFIPDASPDMASVEDRLEFVLLVRPIWGTWLVLKIELMVLELDMLSPVRLKLSFNHHCYNYVTINR
jgi:hypothetical protein